MEQVTRRKRKLSPRRQQLAQGKRQVEMVLTTAVVFYAIFMVTSWVRFGPPSDAPVAFGVVLVSGLLAITLAIAAYVTHRILRQFFLLLNIIGLALGIVWIGLALALDVQGHWVLLDAFGVLTAGASVGRIFIRRQLGGSFLNRSWS